MATQKIQQEMAGLAAELATLRLPHKLNQYRVYERKLRSVEKQIKEEGGGNKGLETELAALQSALDGAVLCGVSQCFICGGGNAEVQLGSPKQFPVTYSRSVSAHANYANQRGKFPLEGSASASGRQYGKQISYHGRVANSATVAAEKGVSSPPPPPPDIVPTLSPLPQNSTISTSPSPSLSPSISLTPSPSPSPTPSSPAPTASPLPPFEAEEEEETSVVEKKVAAVENGDTSDSASASKGTAVILAPEIIAVKSSTPPASPKMIRTASPNKPSTPPPPPPLSPKPHPRSPSPKFTRGPSPVTPVAAINGSIKRAPEKPSLPPPPPPTTPPSSVSPQPTVRPKSAAVSGTAPTSSAASSSGTTSKPSIFSAAPFRSTASSYRAYKDFISSYTNK